MVLEFDGVRKEYKSSNFKLDDINFDLAEGEVLGLIGQNGSGKSTILKMANQLVKQDAGSIKYLGQLLESMSDEDLRQARKKIVYIFQSANLLENKTVLYHLKLVYKLNKTKVDEDEINEILDFMQISRLKKSYVRHLSGGQKQKLAIAMALLQKPKVLLCDEISSALDASAEREIFDLLAKIVEERKISIIIISHNLDVLKNFSDRILLLDKGQIQKEIIPIKSANKQENNYFNHVVEYFYD